MSRWDVAVLNDDAVPPPNWFDGVASAMRDHGADAASSDPFDQMQPGMTAAMHAGAPMSVHTRLAGWAMMLRGEWEGAHFDERLRWWFGDDELSLRAREAGGLVHVGGYPVPNTHADTSTVGVLAEQAGRDRATFVEITGRQPW
jgi:GT2 family glycosyltransferase